MFNKPSTIRPAHHALISRFAAECAESGLRLFQVRGNNDYARSLRASEIRSTKHTHLAFARDELGNVVVLKRDGGHMQLISDAEIRAVGIR